MVFIPSPILGVLVGVPSVTIIPFAFEATALLGAGVRRIT
ncbi:hypothetical protein RINTU1_07480 [Candidatus Regiella insecticola]|uniref:Uncharacterized protein n=1 Tax=Candidatus Regiella insecticola TaxID=138073 RepID=A0A6L2ZMF2_9ENTR|nr:hypothetical protein RINTU1_07480 [Candidatus Regiella insecticola]